MSENVWITRLTSGEEVIALSDQGEGHIILKKPMILVPVQEGRLTMASWLPYNKSDTVTITESCVMFVIEPVEEMVNNYLQAVGEKKQIFAPEKKIII